MTTLRTSLSIVVPLYNEEENLPELGSRISSLVERLGFKTCEVLLINDGSDDRSEQMIWELVRQHPIFKGIFLTRNFGHQAAVSVGLAQCAGDIIAIIDGDLQDPPEAIDVLLASIEGGADVAYGVRSARKENIVKRAAYAGFYRFLRSVSSIEIPLDTGDFCLMRRTVVEAMLRLPERNRFVRGIRAWVGYKQVGVPYERAARFAGLPKYTLRKLMALAYDGLFSFSALPVRIMQTFGFLTSGLALLTAVVYLILKVMTTFLTWPTGFATLVISIWFLGGLQLLFMGLVGEYVHRTFDETRQRPVALIRQIAVNPNTAASVRTDGDACGPSTDSHTLSSTSNTGGGGLENAS
jgi:glycosyltransferase involved in cell wall biosynthesis